MWCLEIDKQTYLRMPEELRRHLEKEMSLGSIYCEERNWQCFDVENFKFYPHTLAGSIRNLYNGGYHTAPYFRFHVSGALPGLFYDRLAYPAQSDLGKLYQAAYRMDSEGAAILFDRLSVEDQNHICFYIEERNGRPAGYNWGREHAFDNMDLLFTVLDKWILKRFYHMPNPVQSCADKLREHHKEPSDNTNPALLADAMMYFVKKIPLPN